MAQSSITSTSMRLSRASRAAQTAVGARDGQIAKQRRRRGVERRVSVAASLLRQRAGHEAFADAGRSEHEDVFVIARPRPTSAPGRGSRSCPARAPRDSRSLRHRHPLSLAACKPPCQRLVLAPAPLVIHQQAEPFQKAQLSWRPDLAPASSTHPPCPSSRMAVSFSIIGSCSMFALLIRSTPRRGCCHAVVVVRGRWRDDGKGCLIERVLQDRFDAAGSGTRR